MTSTNIQQAEKDGVAQDAQNTEQANNQEGEQASAPAATSPEQAAAEAAARPIRAGEAKKQQVPEELFSAVGNVFSQLEAVERFMARRFDELSMEINATSQQVDMAEDGMARRFSEILEILGAINYTGGGDSSANTGVELEAVIEDTESAANKILDSADRIASYVDDDMDWNDEDVRADVREKIKNDIQDILLACTFQDLTGQRIRNTLNSLHDIETRLSSTFERLGIDVQPSQKAVEGMVTRASSQDEIDALLTGYSAAQGAAGGDQSDKKPASQDDIDSMFD